ncbi:MAG: hypothetical protein M1827_005445 [Pycnora praestabilis]|nr:MAG: hypothetical protein M1827_005445 [Pycnora praestabilis]
MATSSVASQRQAPSGTSTRTLTTTTTEQTALPTRLSLPTAGTLRLRGSPASDNRVRWAEDVIDNEGMGKKSSKVCCIYHKPRAVGESSDEDSSDSSSSSSDSDNSEPDNSTARKAGGGSRTGRRYHHHEHDEPHDECGGGDGEKARSKGKGVRRKGSPNAYEKMPKGSGAKGV